MPMSATARRALQAPATAEVVLFLLTIEHSQLSNPLRFVGNTANVTSRGNTYVAAGFAAQPPSQVEEGEPTASIEIKNIDRAVEQTLALLTGEPTFTIELVLASALDTLIAGPYELPLGASETSSNSIRLTLGGADPLLSRQFPRPRFSSEMLPGLSAS
jgi:hypothetical protein